MRIFILTLLLVSSTAFAQTKINFCHAVLTNTTDLSFTEIFFIYLQELNKQHIVATESLKTLKIELEKQITLSNPVTNKSSSHYGIHASSVQDYLNNSELNHKTLLSLLNEFLKKEQKTQESKNKSSEQTQGSFTSIKLHPVEKGGYVRVLNRKMDPKEETIAVNHSFMAMQTHVTEHMWFKIFKALPSTESHHDDQVIMIEGQPVRMRPDRPITRISLLSAMMFANEISRLHGLKPAYIIDSKQMHPQTRAGDGTLRVQDEGIYYPAINAMSGKIEDTEGYRIPTFEEQQFLRTARGQVKTNEFFPDTQGRSLLDYAWFNENSSFDIHPVAEKNPFIIDGNAFYDLYGNVAELTTFAGRDSSVYIGGNFISTREQLLGYEATASQSPGYVGFRLVRTIKENP